MRISEKPKSLWAVLPLSLPASALAAILVVDPGGPFTQIDPAVLAAGPGDTIVVHPSAVPYAPFTVAGKDRLHIVGASTVAGGPILAGSRICGVQPLPPVPPSSVVVDGAGTGMSCATISGSSNVSITGIRFRNCDMNGIEIVDSKDTVIVANRVERPEGVGILVIGGPVAPAFDTQIVCNIVALTATEGIVLDNAEATLVADNLVGRAGAAGVFMAAGTGFNNQVVTNDIRNSGRECIVASGTEARLERNSCSGPAPANDILIDAGSNAADVVGNNCVAAGLIIDLGVLTETSDNLCP